MYEQMTQEHLMEQMLAAANDEVSVIEGSFLYNAISLAAVALEDAYDELEGVVQNGFPDTCDREHLIRFGQSKGISPYPAVAARYVIDCNITPEIGTTFTDGELNFVVTQIGTTVIADCEEAGVIGNGRTAGTALTAVDYVENLTSCEIVRLYTSGEEAEETEAFRARYLEALNVVGMYGNKKTYEDLLRSYGVTGKTYIYADGTDVHFSYLEEDGSLPASASVSTIAAKLALDTPLGRTIVADVPTVTAKSATATFSKTDESLSDADARARIAAKLNAILKEICVEYFDKEVVLWPATLTAAIMDGLTESDGLDMVNISAIGAETGSVTKPAGAMWTNWTVVSA